MKKILYLLVALLPLWCVSCSDDDDDEPGKTKDGKRLIAKIIKEGDDENVEVTFEYDKEARLKRYVEVFLDYDDSYEDATFSYSSEKIVAKMKARDDADEPVADHSVTFVLNGQGFISEYEAIWYQGDRENEWVETGAYVYNKEGQLLNETIDMSDEEWIEIVKYEYTWVNGEMIMIERKKTEGYRSTHSDAYTVNYTEKENKTNIDFIRVIMGSDVYIDCMGFAGKTMSEYLPKSYDGEKIYYEFDNEDYPVKIEYGGDIYTIEYK